MGEAPGAVGVPARAPPILRPGGPLHTSFAGGEVVRRLSATCERARAAAAEMGALCATPRRGELLPNGPRSDMDASSTPNGVSSSAAQRYFDTPLYALVCTRFPWLLSLMLVQSLSGWVIERERQ